MATDNTNESAGIFPRQRRKVYATFLMEDNTVITIQVPVRSPLAGNRYSAYYNGPIKPLKDEATDETAD